MRLKSHSISLIYIYNVTLQVELQEIYTDSCHLYYKYSASFNFSKQEEGKDHIYLH